MVFCCGTRNTQWSQFTPQGPHAFSMSRGSATLKYGGVHSVLVCGKKPYRMPHSQSRSVTARHCPGRPCDSACAGLNECGSVNVRCRCSYYHSCCFCSLWVVAVQVARSNWTPSLVLPLTGCINFGHSNSHLSDQDSSFIELEY